MHKVNLAQVCDGVTEAFQPVLVGALNGQHVRLAKIEGAFVWHDHADEDELFLVLQGQMRVELRDRSVTLNAGELFIVPRGTEHRTVADEAAHVLIFVKGSAVTTGAVQSAWTMRPDDF